MIAFLQGQDFDQLCRTAFERHGITAGAILDMTPAEIMATFFVTAGKGETDRLAELAQVNRERGAKGLQPSCPSWHLTGYRRKV